MTKDDLMMQAIGELREANKNIAISMVAIQDNLKTLNDHNILHAEKNSSEHTKISEQIQLLTGRYWWLILALLIIILVIMGYKEAIKYVAVG
jgi:hypothetical protein